MLFLNFADEDLIIKQRQTTTKNSIKNIREEKKRVQGSQKKGRDMGKRRREGGVVKYILCSWWGQNIIFRVKWALKMQKLKEKSTLIRKVWGYREVKKYRVRGRGDLGGSFRFPGSENTSIKVGMSICNCAGIGHLTDQVRWKQNKMSETCFVKKTANDEFHLKLIWLKLQDWNHK